jgi:hypothetical protein
MVSSPGQNPNEMTSWLWASRMTRSPSIGMQANQNLASHRRRPPDRIEVTGTAGLTGTPIQSQDWATLAQMVHEAGERS